MIRVVQELDAIEYHGPAIFGQSIDIAIRAL